MNVTKIIAKHLQHDMGNSVWNAQQRWSAKHVVLVFIETDTAHIGLGECWVTGADAGALIDTIDHDIAPLVIGKSPFHVNRIWHDVFATTRLSGRRGITSAALSGVDTALWDLMGKHTGAPLYQLLGAYDDQVWCYASAGLYGKDKAIGDLAAEARDYQAQGFTDVKIKVGGVALSEDVARVRAVRDAIGPAARLMVDANYNLDVPAALRMANAFAPFDITWLEAPVNPDDVAGQAKVNRDSPIPVCGNETETGRDPFRRLIEARAVEYVQPDIAVCGGISEARRVADLAAAHHLPVTLHSSSTVSLLAATLHLAASIANLDSVEYHMLHRWMADRFPDADFTARDGGFVRPPTGPGLGLTLHPDAVDRLA
jgi:L-alanine-DL-glutamate epimerase-like enolase superfamily enzyme